MIKVNKILKNRLTNKNIKCRFNDIHWFKVKNIFYLFNLDNITYSNHLYYYQANSNRKYYYVKNFNNKGNLHSFKKFSQYLPAEIIYDRKINEERYLFYDNGNFLSYDVYNNRLKKNENNK
jgi:hypothetical protein